MKSQWVKFILLTAAGLTLGATLTASASGGHGSRNDLQEGRQDDLQDGGQDERRVRVNNEASSPIYQLYFMDETRGNMGPDLLAIHDSIPTGQSRNFVFDESSKSCFFDVEAILKDGRHVNQNHFDVCTERVWTVKD